MLRLKKFEMSSFSVDKVWEQFDRVEVEGRSLAECKHCHRRLTGHRAAMCTHYRTKHLKPPAYMLGEIDWTILGEIDSALSKPMSDAPTSELPSDALTNKPDHPACNPMSDEVHEHNAVPPDAPTSNPDQATCNPMPGELHGHDEDMHKVTNPPLSHECAKDAVHYLALCATTPTAFRHAIDSLPKSSIKRIYDVVCNAAKSDAQPKLSPKQRRMCDKYRADSRSSSKTKRRLLRSANKQAIRSVLGPLMLQTALVACDSGLKLPTL
jgi:hypothetical protein